MDPWIDEGEADAYMGTRLGASEYWATGVDKAAALATAQRDLVASGLFAFPEVEEATVEEFEAMTAALCEQALFLLRQGAGADMRADLQAQGVVSAGIVQEQWVRQNGVAITQRAVAALAILRTGATNAIPWEK